MRLERHQCSTRTAQAALSSSGTPIDSQAGATARKVSATAQVLVMRMKYIIGNWRENARYCALSSSGLSEDTPMKCITVLANVLMFIERSRVRNGRGASRYPTRWATTKY